MVISGDVEGGHNLPVAWGRQSGNECVLDGSHAVPAPESCSPQGRPSGSCIQAGTQHENSSGRADPSENVRANPLGRIVPLQVILPRLMWFPDLDKSIGNSFSTGIDNLAINADLGSASLSDDGFTQFHRRRILAVKRAEKTRLCATRKLAIRQETESESGLNRILGLRGANTGSYGFDMPCLASQSLDPCLPVAHKRPRLHTGKHRDYGQCAKPALLPGGPQSSCSRCRTRFASVRLPARAYALARLVRSNGLLSTLVAFSASLIYWQHQSNSPMGCRSERSTQCGIRLGHLQIHQKITGGCDQATMVQNIGSGC